MAGPCLSKKQGKEILWDSVQKEGQITWIFLVPSSCQKVGGLSGGLQWALPSHLDPGDKAKDTLAAATS